MNELLSRKGFFKVDTGLLEEAPYLVQKALSQTLVVKAESSFIENHITYWAYSDHFEELNDGEIIPEYEVIIRSSEDAQFKIEWRKK